ncbi:hypothetical protein KAR91_38925 [Candidatus Pacearchaeota archaeon]|nr:hypothetical protein [Candidatus Pacearchaeota archaeon]
MPCVEQGDTFIAQPFVLEVNDALVNLTGATIVLTLDPDFGTLTTVGSGGITITNAEDGEFEIDEQVIDFPKKVYSYEITFTLSDGSIKAYVIGTWTIL